MDWKKPLAYITARLIENSCCGTSTWRPKILLSGCRMSFFTLRGMDLRFVRWCSLNQRLWMYNFRGTGTTHED